MQLRHHPPASATRDPAQPGSAWTHGETEVCFYDCVLYVEKIMTPYLQKILPNTTRHRNPFAINCCKIHLHPAQDQTIITYWGKPNHITVQIKLSVSNKILATYVTSEVSGAPSTGVTKDINGRAPEILTRPKRSAVASIVSCSNHEIEVLPQFHNGTCVVFVVPTYPHTSCHNNTTFN